jgi:hypothetical protein
MWSTTTLIGKSVIAVPSTPPSLQNLCFDCKKTSVMSSHLSSEMAFRFWGENELSSSVFRRTENGIGTTTRSASICCWDPPIKKCHASSLIVLFKLHYSGSIPNAISKPSGKSFRQLVVASAQRPPFIVVREERFPQQTLEGGKVIEIVSI